MVLVNDIFIALFLQNKNMFKEIWLQELFSEKTYFCYRNGFNLN